MLNKRMNRNICKSFVILLISSAICSFSSFSSGGSSNFGNEYGSTGGMGALGGGQDAHGYKDFGGYSPSHSDFSNGAHASGLGSHRGDQGASNIFVARDVVHHGDGSLYVQKAGDEGGAMGPAGAMNVDDIHNAINKAIMDAHAAELAKKNSELKENQIKKDIADQQLKARNDQINMLKELDKQAMILEQQKPEVLGKKAIPIANFTEDSFPLRHHTKMIYSKIKAIKEAERKMIAAQEQLTKLDDITDKFKFDNARIASPKLYNKFLQVGGVKSLEIDIPVFGNKGSFYIKGNAGHGSHGQGGHIGSNINEANGHSHYNDHGYHVPGSGLSGSTSGGSIGNSQSYGDFYRGAVPYNSNIYSPNYY